MKGAAENKTVLLIFILAAIFLIGGWFWFFKIYPEQRQKKGMEKYDCLAKTTRENYRDLLARVDGLFQEPAGQEIVLPGISRQDLTRVLARRYLDCQIKFELDEKEKEEKIEVFKRVAADETSGLKENLKSAFVKFLTNPEKNFFYIAAHGDSAVVCPTDLAGICGDEVSRGLIANEQEWCPTDICQIIANHQQNKDKTEKEILNFEHEADSTDFLWRIALAFRFTGRDLASQICEKISADRDRCRLEVIRFESFKMDCREAKVKLNQLVCGLGFE